MALPWGVAALAVAAAVFLAWRGTSRENGVQRVDGRELYYLGRDGQAIMSVPIEPGDSFRAGTPHPLLRLPRGTLDGEISPDGQRIFVHMPNATPGRSVINLVMNWSSELREEK